MRWYQGYRATSWRVDETYVKVGGRWKYLFRAVDKHGRLIDFMLADRRNTRAACRFLGKALTTMRHWPPSSITTDQLGSYRKAILRLQQEGKLSADTKHRTCKYLNNIIEADHGALKRVIRPPEAFKRLSRRPLRSKGFEVMRMIRRGHCLTCKPQVKDEIRFVNKLFDTFPVAALREKVARQTAARQVNATEPKRRYRQLSQYPPADRSASSGYSIKNSKSPATIHRCRAFLFSLTTS